MLDFSSGQERDRRRLVRAVQHVGPVEEEEHRRGVGPDAGGGFQEAGRHSNKIRILGPWCFPSLEMG